MLLNKRRKRNKSYYKFKSRKPYKRKKRYNENDSIKRLSVIRIVLIIAIVAVFIAGISLPLYSYFSSDAKGDNSKMETSDVYLTQEQQQLLLTPVNRAYPLEADYLPQLQQVEDIQVNVLAVNNLEEMLQTARNEGINLQIISGYVSYEEQTTLYNQAFSSIKEQNDYSDIKAEAETVKIVSKPGESEAQTGLLVSFADGDEQNFSKSKSFYWLQEKATDFGFVLRYPQGKEDKTSMAYNPQCYRYVGKDYAMQMQIFGLTLEEYKDYLEEK